MTPDDSKLSGKRVRSTVAAARKLRRNMSDVEQTLWNRIRDKQIEEFRFRRQRPMGRYVVDFVCLDAKLIVELDGGQHADQIEADKMRTEFLEALGFAVMRFWNNEVIENIDGVLERIREQLLQRANSNSTPTLPFAGEGADRDSVSGSASAAPGRKGRRVRERLSNEFAINRKAALSPATSEDDGNSLADSELTPSPAQRGMVGMGVRSQKDAAPQKIRKPK